MKKQFADILTDDQRQSLSRLMHAGTADARALTPARIRREADQRADEPGWIDARIAEAVEGSRPTNFRVRRQFVEEGVDAAWYRQRSRRV